MIFVPKTERKQYYDLLLQQLFFQNYIRYLIEETDSPLYVDQLEEPHVMIFVQPPARILWGDPKYVTVQDLKELIPSGSWIIPDRLEWKEYLELWFQDRIQTYPRMLFDASKLNLEHIISLRKPLPSNLRIEPIQANHLRPRTMIYEDILKRFFPDIDFMSRGFGFVLLDESNLPQGFCMTNYPAYEKEVECTFRVGYDDFTKYRGMGLGLQLCTYFLEYCFQNGYHPVWDAAHETSSHIAKKLGFIEQEKWYMFHLK